MTSHEKPQLVRWGVLFRIAAPVIVLFGAGTVAHATAEASEALAKADKRARLARWSVKRITTITEFGKSVDWSARNDMIVSARRRMDGYYDVFKMRPDGNGFAFLTGDGPEYPHRHNGNPAWNPDKPYIVFTAENGDSPLTPDLERYAFPGSGLGHDLWVMNSDGTQFHRLTAYALTPPLRAVIHPQFSNNGERIAWAERVARGQSFGGGWVMKLADFVEGTSGTAPRLDNTLTLKPVEKSCFYEVHDFSPDDKRLLFSGDLQPGQPHVGLDIYELNLENQTLKRLTDSDEAWDEHAHYSPDGSAIAWMSSQGLDVHYGSTEGFDWADYLKTELWIMNADGSGKQQLTHFNTPGYPEYMGGARCIVSDSSWSPDGTRLVACVAWFSGSRVGVKLMMVEVGRRNERSADGGTDAFGPCSLQAFPIGLSALGAWRLARR